MFGLSELAVILVVVVAVLAVRKLPDVVRSAGKSARILKAESSALKSPVAEWTERPGGAPQRDGRP
ncbi:twin-arginine translocase TatA/TatE family subunit [Streptomyces sp. CHD11]|nr:twin-arginine translocase TatA/TatE family subunit [Streptomyces sp. CHD11]